MRNIAKKLFLLFAILSPMVANALTVPEYNQDTYYLVKFMKDNKYYLTAGDNNANITTETATTDNYTDKQMWKFTGTSTNLQLINKAGQYAVFGTDRIQAAATADASGWTLVNKTGHYELKWNGRTTGDAYMNQHSGTGSGTTLGLWTPGDPNNAFVIIDPLNPDFPEFATSPAKSFSPEHPLTLWYDKPATATGVANIWMEYSLPIGSGQLGASLFGGIMKDEIQFNDKTLWEGTPNDMGAYGGYKNFGSVFVEDLSGTFGFTAEKAAKNYSRSLDIENGTASVHYTSPDGTTEYERTYLASHPDKVVAARYKATGTDKLHLLVSVVPGTGIGASNAVYSVKDGVAYAFFSGKLTTVSHATRMQVVNTDGTIVKTDNGLEVKDATEVALYLAPVTDFDGQRTSRKTGESKTTLNKRAKDNATAAAEKGFDAIYADHVADFMAIMHRVQLDLKASSTRTTEDLIKHYNSTAPNPSEARFLEQLYFQFGRYLAIASNRGTPAAPNNLQGIWNDKENAPWNSDIHTNINIQMNYWPTEVTNLSEMHLMLLDYIIQNAADKNWQRAAREKAGATKGWTVFTESNIFGGMSTWGDNYFVANAWYCSHLWQHYRFTRDKDFLARAFPAMWSTAQFWMERMIEDRGYDSRTDNSGYKGAAYKFEPDGTFVAPDEYSAEQDAHNREDGTAHAQQLIYALLQSVKEATEILPAAVTGLSEEDIRKLDLYLEKTDRGLHTEVYTANTDLNGGWTNPRNGVKRGDVILREWKYSPYDVSNDPSHRHMSHLMGLFPLSTIGPNSPYFQPAVNSLKLRGDEATGWSMGWKVNLWARALDGDHAHIILKNALKHSTSYGTNQYAGGIYYNLYDSHAPFQIDGNFGVCSGIAEMLLQSHTDTIQLLPALSKKWPEGSIGGLKAVGDFEVSQAWESGKLTVATIRSNKGLACPVNYKGIGDRRVTDSNGKEVTCERIDEDNIVIPTIAGEVYTIDMSRTTGTEGIKDTQNKGFKVARTENAITVTGRNITKLEAYDAAGRLTGSAHDNTVSAGRGIVMLKVTEADGTTTGLKVN